MSESIVTSAREPVLCSEGKRDQEREEVKLAFEPVKKGGGEGGEDCSAAADEGEEQSVGTTCEG